MFCPQCGYEQVADEVRYCSRCGLELGVVRAYLAGTVAPTGSQSPAATSVPRQRNINLGVVLMFLGTLLTSLFVDRTNVHIEGAFLLLLTCFLTLLLFSRPIAQAFARLTSADEAQPGATLPARRRELSHGATFMFIGALLSGCAAAAAPGGTGTPIFFAVLLSFFGLFLLTSHRIMRAVQTLLTDDKAQPQAAATVRLPQAGSNSPAHALPPAQSVPVSIFTAQRATTAEMVAPPSVTERTTSLLQDE
jgi:MYXO-CTERM domain-containing protein